MLSGPEPPAGQRALSKHRIEALTDGVYAIAITILVLELKLPEATAVRSQADLVQALVHLIPKFVAWIISFFVLAIFWVANHRLFQWIKSVDPKLLWITILTLMGASFLPFGSALVGEFSHAFISQAIYAADMGAMGLLTLWMLSHLERHPELCHEAMPAGVLKAARIRCWGIVATAALAVAIAAVDPRFGTMAFVLMGFIARASRRHERTPPLPQQATAP